jgi:hypothetical protein
MEETGVLENPNWVTRLLPAFEPGPNGGVVQTERCQGNTLSSEPSTTGAA